MASNSENDDTSNDDHQLFEIIKSLDGKLENKPIQRYTRYKTTKDTTLIKNLSQMENEWEGMTRGQLKCPRNFKDTKKKMKSVFVKNKLIINDIFNQLMSNHQKLLTNLGQTDVDIGISPLSKENDITTWLVNFEKIAKTRRWPRLEWGNRIGILLTGPALKAYEDLATDEREDFHIVKEAILQAYGISVDVFSHRFFATKWKKKEPFSNYAQNRMQHLKGWLAASSKSVEDTIIMEIQFREWFEMKEFDLLQYVQNQEPQNWKEVSIAVEQYISHNKQKCMDNCNPVSNYEIYNHDDIDTDDY